MATRNLQPGDTFEVQVGGDTFKISSSSTTLTPGAGSWTISDADTSATYPWNVTVGSVKLKDPFATHEELAQVVASLSVCVLCGSPDCWVVCNLCKMAIVEVRNRLVEGMIEELRP